MKRRKILLFTTALLFALSLSLGLAACGKKNRDTGGDVTYSVTYAANNGTGATASGGSYHASDPVTIFGNPFTYPDHVFNGWRFGDVSYAVGATLIMPEQDVILKAQWLNENGDPEPDDPDNPDNPDPDPDGPAVKSYTVTYLLASDPALVSSVAGTPPDSYSAKVGAYVAVPTVDWTCKGYSIDHWCVQTYNAATQTWSTVVSFGELRAGSFITMPEYDIWLAPVWKGNAVTPPGPSGPTGPTEPPTGLSYAIGFAHASNAPEGVPDNFPDIKQGVSGETITLPVINYNIPHVELSGWNIFRLNPQTSVWEEDTTYPKIPNGGSFVMPNYAIVLYTNFMRCNVTIKFDSNGGSGTMPDITSGTEYGSNISIYSSKLVNKFTGPGGAAFKHWSLTRNGISIFAYDNAMALTEANGVSADNVLVLYAIWDTTQVVDPDPVEGQDIQDFVGKWDTRLVSGNHSVTIVAAEGSYGLVGYAVLDGKEFITIYLQNGALAGANTDDEYGNNYLFQEDADGFTLKVYDTKGHFVASYAFTQKAAVIPISGVLGKWMASPTQKVVLEEGGIGYYSYQGVQTIAWVAVGEYLVFWYTANNGYNYYYILTKGSALSGYFLAPDVSQAAVTLTQGGFYTFTVDGALTELVTAGSKPQKVEQPPVPNGKVFLGWVLAGTDTPFSFDTPLTRDTSIEAKIVIDPSAADHIFEFIGMWVYGKKTLTKITIDTQKQTVVFTINGVDTAAVSYTVEKDNLVFWASEFNGEKLYAYVNGDSLEIGDFYYGDSRTVHYATFKRS